MATTDLRNIASSDSLAGANSITKRVDFTVYNAGATDVLQLFNLDKGSRIMIKMNVITAEDTAATVDILTTESSPQTLLDDKSIATAGVIEAPVTIWTISEDCILNLLANTAATATAVVDVTVTILDR